MSFGILPTVAARGGLTLERHRCQPEPRLFGLAAWPAIRRCLSRPCSPRSCLSRRSPAQHSKRRCFSLPGEVGLLVTDQEAGRLTDNQSALAGRLIAITRTLIQAANEAGVTLEAAAVKNLAKIFDRWPQERIYPAPLDADAEPEERLPRDLYVDVFEREVRGQTYVFQRCNGINIGDRLTDNAMTADDYRFHDVFHFAYVAVLSWSPVIRSCFG